MASQIYSEYEEMLRSFRCQDLANLLSYAGQSKNGKKTELFDRCQLLLKRGNPNIQLKIKEIYNSCYSVFLSSRLSVAGLSAGYQLMSGGGGYNPHLLNSNSNSSTSNSPDPISMHAGGPSTSSMYPRMQQQQSQQQIPPSTSYPGGFSNNMSLRSSHHPHHHQHPIAPMPHLHPQPPGGVHHHHHFHNMHQAPSSMSQAAMSSSSSRPSPTVALVKFEKLAFYEHIAEITAPLKLVSTNNMGNKAYSTPTTTSLHFTLSIDQLNQVLEGRYTQNGKHEFKVQVHLRFGYAESSPQQQQRVQRDTLPPNLNVLVNQKPAMLPTPKPTSKPGSDVIRPGRSIDITPQIRLTPGQNKVDVTWTNESAEKSHAVGVFLYRKLSVQQLVQQVKKSGMLASEVTKKMVVDKLTIRDDDLEIETETYKVSLQCPLMKFRLQLPGRSRTCKHVQCFDIESFLMMNEKKPTWLCPVCDQYIEFDTLVVDSLMIEIMDKCKDDEVQFGPDGEWSRISTTGAANAASSKSSTAIKTEHTSAKSNNSSIMSENLLSDNDDDDNDDDDENFDTNTIDKHDLVNICDDSGSNSMATSHQSGGGGQLPLASSSTSSTSTIKKRIDVIDLTIESSSDEEDDNNARKSATGGSSSSSSRPNNAPSTASSASMTNTYSFNNGMMTSNEEAAIMKSMSWTSSTGGNATTGSSSKTRLMDSTNNTNNINPTGGGSSSSTSSSMPSSTRINQASSGSTNNKNNNNNNFPTSPNDSIISLGSSTADEEEDGDNSNVTGGGDGGGAKSSLLDNEESSVTSREEGEVLNEGESNEAPGSADTVIANSDNNNNEDEDEEDSGDKKMPFLESSLFRGRLSELEATIGQQAAQPRKEFHTSVNNRPAYLSTNKRPILSPTPPPAPTMTSAAQSPSTGTNKILKATPSLASIDAIVTQTNETASKLPRLAPSNPNIDHHHHHQRININSGSNTNTSSNNNPYGLVNRTISQNGKLPHRKPEYVNKEVAMRVMRDEATSAPTTTMSRPATTSSVVSNGSTTESLLYQVKDKSMGDSIRLTLKRSSLDIDPVNINVPPQKQQQLQQQQQPQSSRCIYPSRFDSPVSSNSNLDQMHRMNHPSSNITLSPSVSSGSGGQNTINRPPPLIHNSNIHFPPHLQQQQQQHQQNQAYRSLSHNNSNSPRQLGPNPASVNQQQQQQRNNQQPFFLNNNVHTSNNNIIIGNGGGQSSPSVTLKPSSLHTPTLSHQLQTSAVSPIKAGLMRTNNNNNPNNNNNFNRSNQYVPSSFNRPPPPSAHNNNNIINNNNSSGHHHRMQFNNGASGGAGSMSGQQSHFHSHQFSPPPQQPNQQQRQQQSSSPFSYNSNNGVNNFMQMSPPLMSHHQHQQHQQQSPHMPPYPSLFSTNPTSNNNNNNNNTSPQLTGSTNFHYNNAGGIHR